MTDRPTPAALPRVPAVVIASALAARRKWGVPASVQLAQWAIESGHGAHAPGCNPFGMKPRKGKNDPCQQLQTTEWRPLLRKYVPCLQPFRVFPSLAAAFDAHAELIATAPVYAPAMKALPDVDAFIARLAPRYATDPLYADKLRSMIAADRLGQLDA